MKKNELKNKVKESFENVNDSTSKFSKKEIEEGKTLAIFSYLSILVLIPYFVEKKNKFVMYHVKEGLNLFIYEVLFSMIFKAVSSLSLLNFMYLLDIIIVLFNLSIICLSIIGILNVCNGKASELPIINTIKIIK